MATTLLYLVRHGEQQRAARDGEDPDLGLSALGAEQARYLGGRLAKVPFDVVRHSPACRAAETVRLRDIAHLNDFRTAERLLNHGSAHDGANTVTAPFGLRRILLVA